MESTWNAGVTRSAVPPASRAVRVGLLAPINEIDPRKAVDYVSGMILDQIFEPPYTTVSGSAAVEPRLFEPLRQEDSRKGLEYSAAIRSGIFFSDGTPLTPEIAVRSLRATGVLGDKAKVEVRGNRVWFTLSAPNPRFDLTLTQSSCSIVYDNGQLLGTGPYMFEERPNLQLLHRSARLRLIRNPHHRTAVNVDEIEFKVLPPESDGTPRALVEALQSGRVDITTALSAADVGTWGIAGVAPLTKPSNSTAFLYMNTARRPLRLSTARRGIASTIDLLEIASKSYDRNPLAFVATTALPPSMNRGVGPGHASAADALRLIEESGLRGARLTLLVPWSPRPYLPKPLAVAQIVQRRLNAAGMTVSLLEPTTSDEYFGCLTRGDFDLALGGWIADNADPADYFDALLSAHAVGNTNFANHSRWCDATTEALLKRFRIDPSDVHRREIERMISEEVPFLPLIYGQSCVVHNRQVRNVSVSVGGSLSLATLTVA